ncbi:unnamed protein product [Candida verbasci]|uniref:Serine/threonine-protein kinase n=1 Tax=Candida verbasci TaxID=1227364 RepID=A0A9W4TX35_9ASCO|nr:unnamed protein product [Candida verbasci]
MSSRSQPLQALQALNNGQLNARSNNITPIKSIRRNKENIQPTDKQQQQQQQQQPKKKKEKLSALCKTPPSIVRTRNGRDYRRGNFLGEGGFARCFQMKDSSGQIFAAKTVAKASIKNEKTKTKLLSEIKIHKSLKHPNIVNFIDCFEDDVNVYILLEICPNQSLMELLKTRKRVSEPEVRLFMVQIVGAIKYLHSRRVIHRDLKLGNIFFDPEMNLKIGDFGLASVLPSTDSKKYTICGTPNYIAPEVLGGKNTGHSFEVDIWAIGIMLYALLIGKPPFQAKDVNVIYERIKKTEYTFPDDKPISSSAKQLIKDLLSLNPLNRPNINEILNYEWFKGPFPTRINESSLTESPNEFNLISKTQSAINFKNAKNLAGIYTPKNKNPVEILKTDLNSENKKLLPQSLSPNDTRLKYQEVDPKYIGKKIFSTNFQVKQMNLNILQIYKAIKELENYQDDSSSIMIPHFETPTLISKWVDYSNKYGFSYQLNNNHIGVLFNDENTILKTNDKIIELIFNEDSWTTIENSSTQPPTQIHRQLQIIDFFSKYMNSNLSKIGSEIQENREIIFLRRYTRNSLYIMFEMSNGNFQFNFSDHHKLVLFNSEFGIAISHISPTRKITTIPYQLINNLNYHNIPDYQIKFQNIKNAIKELI